MEWQLACTPPGSVRTPAHLPSSLDWIAAPVPGTAAQALHEAGLWTPENPLPLHDQDVWYRSAEDYAQWARESFARDKLLIERLGLAAKS